MDIKRCKECGLDASDWEFRDSIGCIAYVECLNCHFTGPCSKNHGRDKEAAIEEAVKLWNESN